MRPAAGSEPGGEPSEAAVFSAEILAQTMSQSELMDLERLLAHSLAHPKPAQLREARLGLLIELCTTQTAEVPTQKRYDEERQRRKLLGEHWPDSTTLSRAFHGWNWACRAAMRLVHVGSAARVSHSQHFRKSQRAPYTRQEVIDAILRFRDTWDRRPDFSAFLAWGASERAFARLHGRQDPRIPSLPVITRLFGDFERARAAAEYANDSE